MGKKRDESSWESLYQEQEVEEMPWYYPELDPDFAAALVSEGITNGKVLDLCTGPGTQAMALAERGFQVTATDISETAIDKARDRSRKKGLEIAFRQADILSDDFGESFDILVDRGYFHVFEPEQREGYVRALSNLLEPGGYLLLKCFSHKEKRREGPYRFSPQEIRVYFRPYFEVLSIEESRFTGTLSEYPKTLFCVMRLSG